MRRLFLLAVVVAVGVALSRGPASAQGDGDKIKKLVADLEQGGDQARYAAAVALADLGPAAAPAVPALVKALAAKDENVRLNAAIALGKVGKAAVAPLADALATEDADLRYYALSALGWVGPDARPAAKAVVACLADKNEGVRRKAAYALGQIAAEPADTVAALVAILGDPTADVRQAAGAALGKYGTKAVPALVKALGDPSAQIAVEAARALGAIGPDAKEAIAVLGKMLLADPVEPMNPKLSATERNAAAADALAKIGKDALPALTAGLKNKHEAVRRVAVGGLGKMGADAVPTLVDALGDPNLDVRRDACRLLGPMRINDKMVVLGLAFALKDKDDQVRQSAASGLQQLGAGAKLATAALLDALKDTSPNIQRMAVFTLLNVRPDTPDVLKTLRLLMKEERPSVRSQAVMLFGPFGADALPDLLAALKDADGTVRQQAVQALQSVQGDLKDALPLVTPLLKSDNVGLRQSVVTLLGRMDDKAIPHLLSALKDEQGPVRVAAINALRQHGAAAKKATPQLVEIARADNYFQARNNAVTALVAVSPESIPPLMANLKEKKDQNLRRFALQALANAGKQAKDALPFLIDALGDSVLFNRTTAVRALGNLGADAKEAVPALKMLLNDPNQNLRTQVQAALKSIQGS